MLDKIAKLISEKGIDALRPEDLKALKDIAARNSDIHAFLSNIRFEDIEAKREQFRAIDLKRCSNEELFKAIMDIVSFDYAGASLGVIMPSFGTYPADTRLYRIRKLKEEDHFIPLKALSKEQDAWNPPSECVTKLERLNDIGESLLYTSLDPNTPVEEMGIKDGERFLLIVYKAKRDVKVAYIGYWKECPELSREENLKMRMIHNILNDIFTKEVGQGTEYLYRASARIAKDYFDCPPVMQDAWCYPSIASKQGYNICFRPENARDILELLGVQICTVDRSDNSTYTYHCQAVAVWNTLKSGFDYYPVDSPECQKLFPEIQTTSLLGDFNKQ